MDLKYLKHLAKKGSTFIHPKGIEATELLISKLNIQPTDNILEIGCGTGGTLIEIISRYNIKVTAVEVLDEMIVGTEERLKSLKLTRKAEIINVRPGEKYPFENNSFDKIYAESVLGFQDKQGMEFMFCEVKRLLKRDGIFVLNDALWKPGVPDNIVNKITLQAHKDFGLAHASPSNIDFDRFTRIAKNCGLNLTEAVNLDTSLGTEYIPKSEHKVEFAKYGRSLSLVNLANGLKYRLKLKKHSAFSNYITSYFIYFNVPY